MFYPQSLEASKFLNNPGRSAGGWTKPWRRSVVDSVLQKIDKLMRPVGVADRTVDTLLLEIEFESADNSYPLYQRTSRAEGARFIVPIVAEDLDHALIG